MVQGGYSPVGTSLQGGGQWPRGYGPWGYGPWGYRVTEESRKSYGKLGLRNARIKKRLAKGTLGLRNTRAKEC